MRMRNLVPELLPRLEAHRLEGLDAGREAFYPSYDDASLVSMAPSICRWLGAPVNGSMAQSIGARPFNRAILDLYPRAFSHVILLVIDGMGLNTLENTFKLAESDPDFA